MNAHPYIGRIVVLVTPALAALSGWLCQLAAQYLPGAPQLDSAELTAIFVAGAGAALAAVVKWLSGLQAHEARHESGR